MDPLELTCEILLRLVLYCAITSGTRSGQVIPRAKVTSLDVAMVGRVQIRYHKEVG